MTLLMAKLRAWFAKPSHRRYVYRVANASLAAAVVFGFATGERAAAALLVVNAVLGLADANVPDEGE